MGRQSGESGERNSGTDSFCRGRGGVIGAAGERGGRWRWRRLIGLPEEEGGRALSDEGDDPELTDKVGPPISEREATAESDKQSRLGSLTGWAHLSVRGRRRVD
jgi:hypothetical protein